jgi:hypothetical protein
VRSPEASRKHPLTWTQRLPPEETDPHFETGKPLPGGDGNNKFDNHRSKFPALTGILVPIPLSGDIFAPPVGKVS